MVPAPDGVSGDVTGVAVVLIGGLSISGPARTADGAAGQPPLGRRACVVLARLAVAQGRSVSRRLLADAVWGEPLPASWQAALRNVVTELRRQLAAAGIGDALAHSSADGGYALHLPEGAAVDVLELRRAVATAEADLHAGNHPAALRAALRGADAPPLEVLPAARNRGCSRCGCRSPTCAPARG